MEKRISVTQFRMVKNVAKAIDPVIRKRTAVAKKIEALQREFDSYNTQISALEAGIVAEVGFSVEELIKKVVEPTGTTDVNGKEIRVTKFLPTNIVSYDDVKKQYVITKEELDGISEQSEKELLSVETPAEVESDKSFLGVDLSGEDNTPSFE